MVKKYYKDWKNFQENSLEYLSQTFAKSRMTFRYRNRHPANGKLYLTDDNKSFYIKLTKKKDIDKIETYFKNILYMMANKPIEKEEIKEKEEVKEENKKEQGKETEEKKEENENKKSGDDNKKKQNKKKKNKKGKK